MKEGRPFEENTPNDLKIVALCVFIGGALIQIVGIVERFLLTEAFPMEKIFASDAIAKVEYVFNIDFGFLLAGAALLLLSYVFAHGRQLQQESDETL